MQVYFMDFGRSQNLLQKSPKEIDENHSYGNAVFLKFKKFYKKLLYV